MTRQTKHYIEVSEILAVRCECKHCHASLSLPLSKNVAEALIACPQCGKGWARLENVSYAALIGKFIDQIELITQGLPAMGFVFSLEIQNEDETR
jgi:hypothetical protein